MLRFYRYHHEYVQYRRDLEKASGIIIGILDKPLKRKYSVGWDHGPSSLRDEIKERGRVLKIDGKQLMDHFNTTKLPDFERAMHITQKSGTPSGSWVYAMSSSRRRRLHTSC
jgi:hypothetical protein